MGKKNTDALSYRFGLYIGVRDSRLRSRVLSKRLTGQWTMRHQDPEVGPSSALLIG